MEAIYNINTARHAFLKKIYIKWRENVYKVLQDKKERKEKISVE